MEALEWHSPHDMADTTRKITWSTALLFTAYLVLGRRWRRRRGGWRSSNLFLLDALFLWRGRWRLRLRACRTRRRGCRRRSRRRRCPSRRTTRHKSSNRRPRHHIRCTSIKHIRVKDTGVIIAISARELYQLARLWHTTPTTSHLQLCTPRIKLGSTHRCAEMQRDNVVANEIITWSEVGRDPDGRDASVLEVVLYPVGTVGFSADLVDFEPLSVGLVEFVAGDGAAGSHVGQHGADVVWPLCC